MSSQDVHDWAGRPVHDGDIGHRLGTRAAKRAVLRRHLEAIELTPPEKAILRFAGEPVFGTCPVCGTRDVELVVVNGRETCRSCPWQDGREMPEPDPDELAELLGIDPDKVREVVDA